ncbi:amino acid adenylation domain-containing protein [Micromonospora tulbaghiae]|uniref:amino acid adenylation domain-containing protein n=1 Tax=Micromonospora tulbaghiae TaxID=479978 RepID=UPI00371F66B4
MEPRGGAHDRQAPAGPGDGPGGPAAARLTEVLAAVLPDGPPPAWGVPLRAAGLSSVATARLVLELQVAFGVEVPMERLRPGTTPADLLELVTAAGTGPDAAGALSPLTARPADRWQPFDLTPLQEAYVFGKDPDLTDDPVGCHLYREFVVPDADTGRLGAAWARVVAHHDMLRMVVEADGRQRCTEDVPPSAVVVHPAQPTATAYAERVAAVRDRLGALRFEPGDRPMHAVEITPGPDGVATVHVAIDAMLVDGHGMALLLDHWGRCYADPAADLPAAAFTARDALLALAEQQDTDAYRADLEYWTDRLRDLPPGPLAGLRPARENLATRRVLTGRVGARQWRVLRARADSLGVSATALVLTLFSETLARHAGRTSFSLVLTTSSRPQLPRDADKLIGPFTDTSVFVTGAMTDLPFGDAVRAVHEQLWTDLGHRTVSGVTALRERRRRDRTAADVALPVVFTSLLDVGPAPDPHGFAAAVTHASSRTSGVVLDHQMWEQDGELRLRWDIAAGRLPAGLPETLFCAFRTALEAVDDGDDVEVRPLNELQMAYYVSRATDGGAPWNGCQVYHRFDVEDLDLDRLEAAWLRLVAAYDPLRSVLALDGHLHVSARPPRWWWIPDIDLSGEPDPEAVHAAMAREMVRTAFPLGRAPQCELRVTRTAPGRASLHLALDLVLLDGRSMHVLFRELLRCYADPDASPTPPVPAEEYLRAQGERQPPAGDGHWPAYWQRRFAQLPPGPALPVAPDAADRRRRRLQGHVDGWRSVRAWAAAQGVTPDALLVAALTRALATEFEEPFTVPVVRWTEEAEPYRPGEFTALSWLTVTPGDDRALIALARDAQAQIRADAQAPALSGLAELRRIVMRQRRSRPFALPVVYTSVLELADHPLPGGVTAGPWLTCTPDVSLDSNAVDDGDRLSFFWDVVDADFAEGSADRLFAGYRRGIAELVTAAAAPAATVDRDTVVYAWNDTSVPYVADGPAHLLFEEQARRRPDAVAVRSTTGTLSYGELNRDANAIAWRLRDLGAGPGTVVGIALRRGPGMIAAVLGVLKAGGIYLPVEPGLPSERAGFMLADAGAAFLLTGSATEGWNLPDQVRRVDPEAPAAGPPETRTDPPPVSGPDDIAYVIYTSGSTGRPKGVAVAHRAVLNLLNWAYRTFAFDERDLGLSVTSLGFDLSVFDILGLLGRGAGLYVADDAQQKDPELLLDVLLDEPVTFWNSAPTTLHQLAPLLPARVGDPGATDLRLVFLSGDYTPLTLPDQVRDVFPNAHLVSLGGATEATVWSNYFRIGFVDPRWRSIPYGRPIDNSRYYILDDDLEPCPVGVAGDLYIAGDCLSAGYWRRPGLTAERFVADPFARTPGELMYRTGDLASYFPDGTMCFLGRSDHQVKIRGFRVELGEVEHRLRLHETVHDVVVLARSDAAGDNKLVAYVIPRPGATPAVRDLRAYAAEALPDYMVPNVVVFVGEFPATSNGKLDRAALPWPVESGVAPASPAPSGTGTPEAAPDLPSEAVSATAEAVPETAEAVPETAGRIRVPDLAAEIAAMFAERLGVAHVDVESDLWDLGATSFTMVQVSGALQRRYRERIPVSVLLSEPTATGMARHLAPRLGAATPVPDSGADGPVAAEGTAAAPATAPEPVAATAPVAPPEPDVAERLDFFDAGSRAAFKATRAHLRPPEAGDVRRALPDLRPADEHYRWRQSRREFRSGPVPHDAFARLLSLLRTVETGERTRALYPSAGDTYAVQVHLVVHPGGVAGVEPGAYYYHPVEHALRLIGPAGPGRAAHFHYNRPLADRAAFEIYLVGRRPAVEPLYGEDTDRFLALEAGYLGQLLMMAQPATGIGLCPIGGVAPDPVRTALRLDDGHLFLQAFLAGPVDITPTATAEGGRPAFCAPQPSPAVPAGPGPEIAVVGVSGRYPDAPDPERLWDNLAAGRVSIAAPPAHRAGIAHRPRPADAPPVPGGFLPDVEGFDSLAFHISPAEARTLDPQLRQLLEVVAECFDNAGHTPADLRRTAPRIGVFVALMWHDHQHVGADELRATGRTRTSAVASDIPNRISHHFGLAGPSLAVNTSCSSSLTALHLAVQSLRRGECDAAVVGAANLFTHPYHLELLAGLDLLTDGGAPGAFSAEHAGWSPGEGVGAVLLRPLADAGRDGNTVHGVIEGTWAGHGGHTGRFGAPSADSLGDAMTAVLADAGRTGADIGYVECAAAGAAMTDAAELEALGRVLAREPLPAAVPAGTIKSAIGHLEAASGLSQLTKALLQLRHDRLAATAVADRVNPLVSWDSLPVRLVRHTEDWPAGTPRRILVNAIGATGSSAHAVLRAPDPVAATPRSGEDQPVVLSAAGPDALREYARRLHERLLRVTGTPDEPALADVARTLLAGRRDRPHRLAVRCADLATLVDALGAFVRDAPHPALRRTPADPPDAVDRWLSGEDVDLHPLVPAGARRVPLPSAPFERPEPASAPPALTVDHTRIEELLRQRFAQVSGIPLEQVRPTVPLEHYGLTSYLVTELNAHLERDFGETSRTLFFEHRDLAGVAGHLAARAASAARPAASAVPPAVSAAPRVPEPVAAPGSDDIAIIGLAGRYPQAPDLDRFWQVLADGLDCVGALPAERARPGWPVDLMRGGFLDGVDRFDPLLFGITPRDADLMDPQERLFLQTAWETLDDAGYPRSRLRARHGSRVGVFVGVMHNEYPFFGVEQSLAGPPVDAGSTVAGIANRVSYAFDLHGPSLAVDTMCSSSLTAVHLAVQSLRAGECEVALAGGVNLSLHPNKFRQQRRMGMTSGDHRCRAFGAGGDGFTPGEGVGAVLLKPLRRAVADGDRIHAVIRATAVNHGGRSNGYLVPDPVAQGDLIRAALDRAGVDPATIGYVEAHGTGTALGDPIEIAGLSRAYGDLPAGSVPIGSVKSTIGHLEAAAGIAGLTKVVLQMRHGRIAPSLHATELNPGIDWDHVPFAVQRTAADWPDGRTDRAGRPVPRRAGISAFGAGGSNAHVVVEAYDDVPAAATDAAGPQLVVLSARDEERLRAVADRLVRFLRAADPAPADGVLLRELAGIAAGRLPDGAPDAADPSRLARWLLARATAGDAASSGRLADIAHTLQVGREPLRERLAVIAADVADLAAQLERFLAGDATGVLRGRAPAGAAPLRVGPDPAEVPLPTLAQQWVRGADVDWARLHPSGRRLVALPSYPFATVRCWLPEAAATPAVPPRAASAVPLYGRTWQPVAAPPGEDPGAGTVVCLHRAPSARLAAELAGLLGRDRTVLVAVGGPGGDTGDAIPGNVHDILGRRPDVRGWIDLCDVDDGPDDDGWAGRLAMVQHLVDSRPGVDLRIVHVTRGLQDLPGAEPRRAGARLTGFVRVLGAEYPTVSASTVDLDGAGHEAAAQIVAEWAAADASTEVAYRAGVRYVPGVLRLEPAVSPPRLDPDRVYVVTGGTRGLGAAAARRLVRLGARNLVVTGRRALPPRERWDHPADAATGEAVAHLRELEHSGARVAVFSGSLAERTRLAAFLDEVRATLGPIGGVVHCAGTGSRGAVPLGRRDLADIRAVAEPKVDGLEVLAELCAADEPSFFVLFSSVSASVPALGAGMADYAAANAFLDLYAGYQVRSGRPWFRSVDWPAWTGSASGPAAARACERAGLHALSEEDGLAVLEQVLALPPATVLLPWRGRVPGFDPLDLIGARTVAGSPAAAPPATAPPASGTADASPVPQWLTGLFCAVLGTAPSDLDPATPFDELGVESIMLGELLERLEDRLARRLEPSTLLDHDTLERLATYLATLTPAAPAAVATGPAVAVPSAAPAPADRRIAVVGMACRFPGAPDIATFWDNLLAGRCAVDEVPPARWDVTSLYRPTSAPGHSISRWGGFLDGIEDFDPDYFGMTADEARHLDPAIRLFMEGTVACLRDAGYPEAELQGRDVGVFVGARMSGYRRRYGSGGGLGGDQNFIAARVAHQFDLRGPNLVVDSACSSALVGVHLAVQSLLSGESEFALAGGVDVLLDEEPYLEFSAARALSPSGRCRTFDEHADGFVPGEGCGVLLLRPLAAAIAAGDRVHAVIDGVAVNNDGRTMGLTTPNPAAQAAVVRRALTVSGRRPDDIAMIEAHGTATMIGDPIELRALTDVYREATTRSGFCAIGSVKSNIGHLLSAAGIAGLIKVILSLEHGTIPPTLFCDVPNPRFDFGASPFFPNTEARPFPAGARRSAGVSAFGLGGTNAHLIATAFDPADRAGAAVTRTPLPPPEFQRRRHWLDRAPASAPPPSNGGTASLLDLHFLPAAPDSVTGRSHPRRQSAGSHNGT